MMQAGIPNTKKTLSVLSLAMINIAALGSIKNWPIAAEYGFSAIFYILIAALVFFIPVALVSAEMATGWPKEGGIFVWVKEAFGHKTGFLSIWLLWLGNVLWYPTILSFISSSIAFIVKPSLAKSPHYTAGMILFIFWLCTALNLKGMKTSSWISTFSVLFGTFIAGLFIIFLGAFWTLSGKPLEISLDLQGALPTFSSLNQLVFFTGMILSFCGIEMSAVHANDVKDPQRNYPKAIWISVICIISLSILGVLSIAVVIPKQQISLTAGSLQAIEAFNAYYHLSWLTPILATLITFGALGSVSTWIVGPTKGLLAAAKTGDLPPIFRKINHAGMPKNLLIFQALLVSILSAMFIFMPTVNEAYLVIIVVVSQLYLIMYLLMFAAFIKLRYKRADVKRAFVVPGKKVGMWGVSLVGILSCLLAFFIGFLPPPSLPGDKVGLYISFLAFLTFLGCMGPSVIFLYKTKKWRIPLPHEKGEDFFK